MNKSTAILFCMFVTASSGIQSDMSAPPVQIDGAKVSDQAGAKRIAFDAYVKKMRTEISATEGVQNISIVIVRLGFDVRDFAVTGDRIWETRVMTVEGLLRAIIWVHPFSEQVHFVCGPWKE